MFDTQDDKEYRTLLPGVQLQTSVYGEKTLMGRFKLARGAEIPSHSHPHEQTGFMVSGRLLFTVDEREVEVKTGDSWCIPGGSSHSVVVLEDSLVVEVFSPVREDYLP